MSHTQRQESREDTASAKSETTLKNPYERVIVLVEEWLADDSGYDEEVGPLLEEELQSHPLAIG